MRHRTGYLIGRSMRYRRCLEDDRIADSIINNIWFEEESTFQFGRSSKSIKTITENNGSSLDLGPFSAKLTQLGNMHHLDLTIEKKIGHSLPFVQFR